MLEFWKTLAYTTKFSAIAFMITGVLGLASMGLLGALLYYPVSFLFRGYPTLNDWRGDWVWPAIIMAGILWSFGFVLGGVVWHYLSKSVSSIVILRTVYLTILWLWAAIIWFFIITGNQDRLT